MQVVVDFSIFDSPASAWGNATGKLDMPRKPVNPSDVDVPRLPEEFLQFPTEVEAVWEEGGSTFVMFNVFAKDTETAAQIGRWFEQELGLNAWPYGEG